MNYRLALLSVKLNYYDKKPSDSVVKQDTF